LTMVFESQNVFFNNVPEFFENLLLYVPALVSHWWLSVVNHDGYVRLVMEIKLKKREYILLNFIIRKSKLTR
jgi:hypothetical protein